MEERKLREMRLEILSESRDYLLGRITSAIELNVDDGDGVLIFSSSVDVGLYRLRFWATDRQDDAILRAMKRLLEGATRPLVKFEEVRIVKREKSR